MVITRYLAVVLAALLVSAGVGAAATGPGSTGGAADVTAPDDPAAYAAEAAYDDGTVTLTVTTNGSDVAGLGVTADGAAVGTTDANGSVSFDPAGENGTVAVRGENVSGTFAYAVANDTVSLDGGFEAVADEGNATNGTENATDGNTTDGNVTDGNVTDGDVTDGGVAEEEPRRGSFVLPGPASRTAVAVQEVIRMFRSGELDGNTSLGAAVSAVAAGEKSPDHVGKPAHVGRPDDAGRPGDAGPPTEANESTDGNETADRPVETGRSDDDRGKPAHAGNGNGTGNGNGGTDDDRKRGKNRDEDEGEGKKGNGRGNGNGSNR